MESPGARLKQVRLEKGCSLEEAHKKTKIHMHIIQAIEEDSVANISPVYLKGFIKIYCAFLGVDPGEYFREDNVAGRPAPERSPAAVTDVPVAAGEDKEVTKHLHGIGFKVAPRDALRPDRRVIIAAAAVIAAVLLFYGAGKLTVFLKSRPVKHTRPAAARRATENKAQIPAARSGKKQPKQAKNSPAVSPAQEIPQSADSEIRMVIRAKEDCWVSLKADGQVVFRSLLRKGRFENFTFKEKGELSLGNAGAVELEINGKFIPNLGRRGQALKNVVISRKGLEIIK